MMVAFAAADDCQCKHYHLLEESISYSVMWARDSQFRQRLLEIERHHRLLEALITKLGS